MSKNIYVYNERTLQYERVVVSKKIKVIKWISILSIFMIIGGSIYAIQEGIIASPKERFLEKELAQMSTHFEAITGELDYVATDLEAIQNKDAQVHRLILGLNPLDSSIWGGGIGGHDRFQFITPYENSADLIESSLSKLDKIQRKINLQKRSLDTIYNLAIIREKKLTSIPSIKPIQEDKLKRSIKYLSGYGFRIHPVHKVKKFHKGIDFTCKVGTPIQATGNGKVIKVIKKKRGYGHHVVIDHDFGYETLYAHMSKIDVKVGDDVAKGQKIGEVGNTGTSTAPHLHYEVHVKGKAVNPIDYCLDGLSPAEYQSLVDKTSVHNQSFD